MDNARVDSNTHQLLNHIADATVLFDPDGEAYYANPAFERLESQFQGFILASAKAHAQSLNMGDGFQNNHSITPVALKDGFALVVTKQAANGQAHVERTLQTLLTSIEQGPDIYTSAVQAIQRCLGWRWVAITRFTQPSRLEILAFTDHQAAIQPFEYDVAGTPRESVVDTQQFTVFSDLQRIFPNYTALKDMGAQTYAGLIYRDANGKPLGHIMAMHDQTDIDYGIAEQVINIATIVIAPQFKLHRAESQLQSAEARSRTDALTLIGNRLAFDDALNTLTSTANHKTRATLAIIDLDHLKPLNDGRGHAAGDRFIQLMAKELSSLGRESDTAFRLGGDEFAVIFYHFDAQFVTRISSAFTQAIARIQNTLRFDVSASIGFASLQEVGDDPHAWLGLADQRMYQHKKAKRQTLRPPAAQKTACEQRP